MRMWFVYILRCLDGSFYTGITTDVDRRIKIHRSNKGSKYVARRGVDKVLYTLLVDSKQEAAQIEYRVKQLEKFDKLAFFREHASRHYSAFD